MTRVRVPSGGITLSAKVDGAEGKPWLILTNSLAADLTMWDDQIGLLTQTHRVIRFDTRGNGDSDAHAGAYDFPMLVADMVAVLDHFGAGPTDVMGLSLGGMTALGLGLTHPGRVRRLVVCDARADAPPAFVSSWDDRIAAITANGMQAIVTGTLSRWFTPSCPQRVRDRAAAMILATPPAGYIGCAHALKALDYLKDLPRLQAPVLYICGADDMGAPKEAMSAMAAATPRARLTVLPGLAHVPNMENPAVFGAALSDWLGATP
ncbi:MAG: alpha/beta fold hydrolase [Pseudomonadota bacterium]